MSFRWLPIVLLTAWPGMAVGQAPQSQAQPQPAAPAAQSASSPLPSGPMRFSWVREGPADKCGDRCREWIAAEGDITGDTPRDFLFFAEARDPRGATIVLNSLGGSVMPALVLGRAFRAKEVTTIVGRSDRLPSAAGEQRALLSPYGTCASMCVFALLGGVKRQVPGEARVLVHQIWPRTKRADAYAESFTADEVTLMQREAGILARYVVAMGADIELFETAMRIPPWERLRPLSVADMRRLRLVTSKDGADTGPKDAKMAPVIVAEPQSAPDVADAGWTVGDSGGRLGLKRRSPITIEGERVGSFEVAFACGEEAGNYSVAYRETRRLPPGGDRLRRVILAVGTEKRALQVESSAAQSAGELRSEAQGQVSQTLVDALAGTGDRSLVVGTQTARNVRAVIRVGTVGFSQSYAKLADSCRK